MIKESKGGLWGVSSLDCEWKFYALVRSEELGVKVRRIKLGSAVEFYRNDEQAVLCNEGDWGAIWMVRPFRHFALSPEIDKSQYEILIRSKIFIWQTCVYPLYLQSSSNKYMLWTRGNRKFGASESRWMVKTGATYPWSITRELPSRR